MNVVITILKAPSLRNSCHNFLLRTTMTIKVILILNLKLATLTSKRRGRGRRREAGKKPQAISGGMDVLNTQREVKRSCSTAARVDVKLFPISGRVWKFNFTAGETISNKHREEEEEEGRRKREGRGQTVNPRLRSHGLSQTPGGGGVKGGGGGKIASLKVRNSSAAET